MRADASELRTRQWRVVFCIAVSVNYKTVRSFANMAMIYRLKFFCSVWLLFSLGFMYILGALLIQTIIVPGYVAERESLTKSLLGYESVGAQPAASFRAISSLPNRNVEASNSNAVDVLDHMHALASRSGMVIDAVASNQILSIPDSFAESARLTVNARGSYVALKATLSELLAMHPTIAIEALTVRRVRSTDIVTDIEIRLTYFSWPAGIIMPNFEQSVRRRP